MQHLQLSKNKVVQTHRMKNVRVFISSPTIRAWPEVLTGVSIQGVARRLMKL